MITIEVLITELGGPEREDLDRWIENDWVRPVGRRGHFGFREIDVARVRLIRELRDDLMVNEEALPVVLSLLDQLYEARRRMREFGAAFAQTAPIEVRHRLAAFLAAEVP